MKNKITIRRTEPCTGLFLNKIRVIIIRKCYHLACFLRIMEIQDAVEKILKISPSVRVVSVCDLKGKLVFSARSKKVNILVSKQQSLASLKAAAFDWKQRKKLIKTLGPCKYVVAEYDKVKRIVIPAGKKPHFVRNYYCFIRPQQSCS